VLPGSLHYRFRTKESILLALMERGISSAEAAFRRAVSGSRDPIGRLRSAIRGHVELLIGGDDATYVLLYEGRGLDGEARAAMTRLRDRYDALWDGLLYQAVGSGRLHDKTDVRLTRLLILGALNWVPQWFNPAGDKSATEIAAVFADTLLEGLLDDLDGA
jgi:AcrR family transcriptional regulator